ncbi:hypothetical protein FQZ97_786240 [compost metagenome]
MITFRRQAPATVRQLERVAIDTLLIDDDEAEIVAVRIVVVAEKIGDADDEGNVFDAGEAVGDDDRRAVGRGDVDRDPARVDAVDVIGDRVLEPGFAVEIVVRREDDLAVDQFDRAVRPRPDEYDAQRITIHIAVVRKKRRGRDNEDGVLDTGYPVIHGYRRIVGGNDIDVDIAGGGTLTIIGDRVGELVRARILAVRPVGEGDAVVAIHFERDCGDDARRAVCRGHVDGERGLGIKRRRAVDAAGRGIDGKPGRQRRTASKHRGMGYRTGHAAKRWHVDGNFRDVHRQRAADRLADRHDADWIAVIVAVVG